MNRAWKARKANKSRVKYLPIAWVWRTLLEMREPDLDPTLIMYSYRLFAGTFGRLYRDAVPPKNETVSKRIDQLEALQFIVRPPPAERRKSARDHFAYPIRFLKDGTADLDGILERDRKARSPIAPQSPPPAPPLPGPASPDWIPGGIADPWPQNQPPPPDASDHFEDESADGDDDEDDDAGPAPEES